MGTKIPISVTNWIAWHEEQSTNKCESLFKSDDSRRLILSFRFRSGLEKNVLDFKRYLQTVSEWPSTIESVECVGVKAHKFYDLIGTTDQGEMSKERLGGWLGYSINVSHEFGCWLQNWDVIDEEKA